MLRNNAQWLIPRDVPTPQNNDIQLTLIFRCPVAILRTRNEIPILVVDLGLSEFRSRAAAICLFLSTRMSL